MTADDEKYVVREGIVDAGDDASDDEQIGRVREREILLEEDHASLETGLSGIDDAKLADPPDLRDTVEVGNIAPDGSSVGRGGLTDPTGADIGGDKPADELDARAGGVGDGALGGSRLDPLGMLDSTDVGLPTDREIEQAISRADGSWVSAAPIDPATGMQTGRDRDLDPPEPPTGRHEDPSYDGEHEHAPPMTGRDQDPTDDEQGDDIVGPGYAQPDPEAGYDVVTGADVEVALRTQGIAPYAQPTEDDQGSEAIDVNLSWAGQANDPRITNYGPDGPQNVEVGEGWAPPPDGIFDPPPESAMADAGVAFEGGSLIGSSTPEGEPDPPPTPPGDDPGGDPWSPPPDGDGDS